MGIQIGPTYHTYAQGDTLEVRRGKNAVWSHDIPRLPLVFHIQGLMLEFCDSKPDDKTIRERCDALAKEFPNGETLVSQNLYCEECGCHEYATSRLPVKRYTTMYCLMCHADRRFQIKKTKPVTAKKPDPAPAPNRNGLDDYIDDLLDLRKVMPTFAPSSTSCDKSLERIDGLVRTLCSVACCEVPSEIPQPPRIHMNCNRHNAEAIFNCDCDRLFAIDAATEAGNPNTKYHQEGECDTKSACPHHDQEAPT